MGESTRGMPVTERIRANVIVDDNGCWRWLLYKLPNGYGMIGMGHACKKYVHRVAHEAWKGPIPPGLVIDHLCRVRDCCNPEHLEAVTPSQNTMRGDTRPVRLAARSECSQGHEYTPENTRMRKDNNGRRCVTCVRESSRRNYERKRAA